MKSSQGLMNIFKKKIDKFVTIFKKKSSQGGTTRAIVSFSANATVIKLTVLVHQNTITFLIYSKPDYLNVVIPNHLSKNTPNPSFPIFSANANHFSLRILPYQSSNDPRKERRE